MNRFCPQPIDWLDYLEDSGDDGLTEHLVVCRSCQVLLNALRADRPTYSEDWLADFAGRTDAVWREDRPDKPSVAEFWFSAPAFKYESFSYESVDRVLLLVLTEPTEDQGLDWLEVVPVRSDVEEATETDVLVDATENSLGVAWRLVFSHQCKVVRNQLDTRVGALGDLGLAALHAALAGDGDGARWGRPLAGPADPRAWFERDFEEAMLRLRTPWLLMVDDDAGEDAGDGPRLALVAEGSALGSAEPQSNVFWLRRVSVPDKQDFALAAATEPAGGDVWMLDAGLLKLHGSFEFNWDNKMLWFLVLAASGEAAHRVRLHVRVREGGEHLSEPFVPKASTHVPVAKQVTEDDIDEVAAEVLP